MVEMVETGVTYEELADIEREFEEVETEIREFFFPHRPGGAQAIHVSAHDADYHHSPQTVRAVSSPV